MSSTARSADLSMDHLALYQYSVNKINLYDGQGSKAEGNLLLEQAW